MTYPSPYKGDRIMYGRSSFKMDDGFANGMALGMVEAWRAALLRTFQIRFLGTAPPDLLAEVRAMDNVDLLAKWFDVALSAPDVNTYRAMTQKY